MKFCEVTDTRLVERDGVTFLVQTLACGTELEGGATEYGRVKTTRACPVCSRTATASTLSYAEMFRTGKREGAA